MRLHSIFARVAGILLCSLLATGARAFDKPPFPRLGGYLIGTPQNYDDPNYQAAIARLNVVVVNVWPTWNGGGDAFRQALQGLKARNPNLLVFQYQANNELQTQDPFKAAAVTGNNWWLYTNGSSGNLVKSTWGTDFFILNTSIFATNFLDWHAAWQVQQFYNPTNGLLDGFFTDNVFAAPRVDGDWNRDGSTDNQSDPQVQTWFRQGNRYFFDRLRQLMPGKFQIGNLTFDPDKPATPEYVGALNGGVIEGAIGMSWSWETWGGWQTLMDTYRNTMSKMAEPKLVILHQVVSGPNDFQGFRYGFATCLMDDGYYYIQTNPVSASGVSWFDEFNVKLGYATSSPPTASWQSGVYRRDFQNGIALVNPKGNGARQVFLEDDFVKISGSQDPNVNNGQTVRSVILQDRDGIILMRKNASTAPVVNSTPAPVSSSSSSSAPAQASSSSASAASASSSTPPATSGTAGKKVPAPPKSVTVR